MVERLQIFAAMLLVCAVVYLGFWLVFCFAELAWVNPLASPFGRFVAGACALFSVACAIFAESCHG